MNSQDADRQIKQMVNFILQEAEEKANEIRIKTEHDFNLEKQMLVHNAKLKLQEEYARKEKEREINKRIARSAQVGASRRRIMIARDELLQQLSKEANEQCTVVTADATRYKELMHKLIVQGLLKFFDEQVTIYCRQQDVALVKGLLADAKKTYLDLVKKELDMDAKVSLEVSEDPKIMLPANGPGGIIISSHQGKITCDNSLETRLKHVDYDLKPQIRNMLFPVMS